MRAKDIIDFMRSEIGRVKVAREDVPISWMQMQIWLDELEKMVEKEGETDRAISEANLAQYRAAVERELAHYEAQSKGNIELFRSVITFAQSALKSSMLINGGAAAGLLAFIGKIWSESIVQSTVDSLTLAIALYASGVLTAAFGTVTSYITQFCYQAKWMKTGIGFHVSTLFIVIGSFIFFGFATNEAYQTFAGHLSP